MRWEEKLATAIVILCIGGGFYAWFFGLPTASHYPQMGEPALKFEPSGSINTRIVATLNAETCKWAINGVERPEYVVPPEVCETLRKQEAAQADAYRAK